MFASRPRNQRNCAALANESGELPVDLEPDWRSSRNRMDEHIEWGWFARWPFVKAAVSVPRNRSKL